HRIELDLLAQLEVGLQVRQILVGSDGLDDVLEGGFDLFAVHCGMAGWGRWEGGRAQSATRRTTSAELMPSMPKERFRIVSTRPGERGSFVTRLRTSQAGSRSSTLIVGWTKPSANEGRLPASSSEPAAPMAWPMKLFVLLTWVRGESEKTARSAWHSCSSPSG